MSVVALIRTCTTVEVVQHPPVLQLPAAVLMEGTITSSEHSDSSVCALRGRKGRSAQRACHFRAVAPFCHVGRFFSCIIVRTVWPDHSEGSMTSGTMLVAGRSLCLRPPPEVALSRVFAPPAHVIHPTRPQMAPYFSTDIVAS